MTWRAFLVILSVQLSGLRVLLFASDYYREQSSAVFENRYHPGTAYYFDDPDNLFSTQDPVVKRKKRGLSLLPQGTRVLKFFDHRYEDNDFAGPEINSRGRGFGAELMFRGDQALFHSFYFDAFKSKTRRSYSVLRESVSVYGLGYKLNISLYDHSEEGSRHYLKSLINGSFYLKAGLEMANSQALGADSSLAAAYGLGFEWGTEFGLFTEYMRHEVAPVKADALKMGIVLRFP